MITASANLNSVNLLIFLSAPVLYTSESQMQTFLKWRWTSHKCLRKKLFIWKTARFLYRWLIHSGSAASCTLISKPPSWNWLRLGGKFFNLRQGHDQFHFLFTIRPSVWMKNFMKPDFWISTIRHGRVPGIFGIGFSTDKPPVD